MSLNEEQVLSDAMLIKVASRMYSFALRHDEMCCDLSAERHFGLQRAF